MLRFGGSYEFTECFEGKHGDCDTSAEMHQMGVYVECSCGCHVAIENAAANDESGAERRHREFVGNVESLFGGPF